MRLFLLFILLVTELRAAPPCPPSFRAMVTTSSVDARYALPIGGAVTLETPLNGPIEAVFLGRLVGHDGVAHEWAFYEKGGNRVHIFPAAQITARGPSGEISAKDLEPMVKSAAQEGATCAAFAMFRCFMLLKHQGRLPASIAVETEQDRNRLLGRLTANYYGRKHSYERTIEDVTERSVDLKFAEHALDDIKKLILASAQDGDPIILSYNLRGWEKRKFHAVKYLSDGDAARAAKFTESGSHWLPFRPLKWWQRLVGYRTTGRHAVMIRGVFEGPDGTRKLWVSDPNFEYPVLWDASELDHADSAKMEAHKIVPPHVLTDADEEK